jgi:hypothetical protein
MGILLAQKIEIGWMLNGILFIGYKWYKPTTSYIYMFVQVIISYIFWCNWLVNGEIITCKINIYIMYSEKQMKPPARNRLPVIAQKSQALSASQRNSDRIKDHGCSDFSETSQLPNHDMSEPQKLQASLPSPLLWSFMHIPRNKHPDEKTPKHGWEKFKGNSQRLSSYFFPIPYPISAVLANVGYVKKRHGYEIYLQQNGTSNL